jgi:maleate isomerase
METELPELFRRRETVAPERFTFHSAPHPDDRRDAGGARRDERGRRQVRRTSSPTPGCDALAYACLVAVHGRWAGRPPAAGRALAAPAGDGAPVVTSAGALVDGRAAARRPRVAMIAPYAPALTARVVDYLADHAVQVVAVHSRDVTDNRAVGRLDPRDLLGLADAST